ncbi:hypothetical protein DV515_00018793, partial [Chloebia gouldiae]
VANLDANENSFSLKEHFFKDIQVHWPGYSKRDRKTLEVTFFSVSSVRTTTISKNPLGNEGLFSLKTVPSPNVTSTSQSLSLGPSERNTPPRTAQVRKVCVQPLPGQKCCFFRAKLIGTIFAETTSGFCLYQSCDDQEAED